MNTINNVRAIPARAAALWATLLVLPTICAARIRAERSERSERGDVPGWVMITLMSAVLVAGLLGIAWPALRDLFTNAIQRVQQ